MNAGSLPVPSPLPEWRHSGRYWLIALALHAAVLLYPLPQVAEQPKALPKLMARLVEKPPAAVPVTPARTQVPEAPPAARREKPAPAAPPPILALPAQAASAPAAFSVPAPVATPAPAESPAANSSLALGAALATVTAASYDAAYLRNPRPEYPTVSQRRGEEGKVLLRVRVTADGSPASVELEKSSNFERLDEAARQIVATRWRFVPARRGDETIESTVIVPLVFRLGS